MRLISALTFGLCIGLVSAPAQQGRGPGRGRGPGFNIGFTALDTNSDGVLDEQEIAAAPAALSKLDKNSDGQITSDEVRPAIPPGRGRGEQENDAGATVVEDTVKTFMAFDANGDGKLSRAELPERFQGIFDRADENKDGFLTPDEIRKVATAQAAAAAASEAEHDGPEGERGGREGGRGGPEGGRGGPRGDMNFIRMDPILAAVDTNGDGVISADEIRNAPDAIRKLDKNGDGKISRDEAAPSNPRPREQ
jgi:Ca2+-binding EF-hand superfamily protein